jgi:hypothetical protein
MGDQGPRYAVYYVPAPDSGLYRFGSAILQYDCYSGEAVPPPKEFNAAIDEWRRTTEEPRRYGFHATLKAPFYLLPSCTEGQLISALQSFAALGRTPVSFRPAVRMLSGFTAVVPDTLEPAVDALAADCATLFDAFRAPISAKERARRMAAGLNHSQIQNLDRWGYPYLFSDFRFHMTLTGKVGLDRRDGVLAMLQAIFQRMSGNGRVAIDRLALVRQDSENAAFRVLSDAPLHSAG